MAHSLSPRARSDIDDIAYYVSVESGSLETADRLIESIYNGSSCWGSIRTLAGDKVTVEMTPYDLDKGRVIFRHKDMRASSSAAPQRRQFRR